MPRSFFILFSLIGIFSAVAEVPIEHIRIKQIEVLRMLADEGVVAAEKELTRRAVVYYRKSPETTPFNLKQQLTKTAAIGHESSLYRLAHLLLSTPNTRDSQQKEALILLSESALLGYAKAIVDIRHLPDILPLPDDVYVQATNNAKRRFLSGPLIQCERIQVTCVKQPSERWREQKINEFGSLADFQNFKTLMHYFEAKITHYSGFDEDRLNRFSMTSEQKNEASEARYQNIRQAKRVQADTEWEEIRYQDRQARKAQAALNYLKAYQTEDWEKFKPQVIQLLEQINRHRDPGQQITLKWLETQWKNNL